MVIVAAKVDVACWPGIVVAAGVVVLLIRAEMDVSVVASNASLREAIENWKFDILAI
jgi:hypothetical protein